MTGQNYIDESNGASGRGAGDELVVAAPAKVNVGLEVLRRRSDGYHDINTLFLAVDLADEIRLAGREDGAITLSIAGAISGAENLGPDSENLCVRAAELLRRHVGDHSLGLAITLTKRIPTGAGLGGGSSDAAAVLRGAATVWGIDSIDEETLVGLALELGSDVPFFLRGGLAHATSRGEQLTGLDAILPYTVLLVNPGVHVSTPWAYARLERTAERAPSDLVAALANGIAEPHTLREAVLNDFEPAVFREYPLLGRLKERLYNSGAFFALMSGSGSTLFGLFHDRETALRAASSFAEYWSAVVRPYGAH